jgi:hypothetical protein
VLESPRMILPFSEANRPFCQVLALVLPGSLKSFKGAARIGRARVACANDVLEPIGLQKALAPTLALVLDCAPLACPGSLVNGPSASQRASLISSRVRALQLSEHAALARGPWCRFGNLVATEACRTLAPTATRRLGRALLGRMRSRFAIWLGTRLLCHFSLLGPKIIMLA